MLNSKSNREAAESQPCFLPDKNSDYLHKSYWDDRFEKEDEYEWFKSYEEFRTILLQNVGTKDRVLILGCGNSNLAEDLLNDNITNITSTDLSEVVVDRMRKKYVQKGLTEIQWMVADMLDLPFEEHSYDVVIEKGAMDVLLVDNESPWDPSLEVRHRVQKMLSEVHRVLTPTGLFISITFGQPHFRRPLFESQGLSWSTQFQTFGESFHYFLYILRKGTRDSATQGSSFPLETSSDWKVDMVQENVDSDDFLLKSCLIES